jgi:hypothetical protein
VLKGTDPEELVKRRKVLHASMITNLTEELDVESAPFLLLSNKTTTSRGEIEEEIPEYKSLSQKKKCNCEDEFARDTVLKKYKEKNQRSREI